MRPSDKNHKTADRRGGVNHYGQPDHKISGFFLTTSQSCINLDQLLVFRAMIHHSLCRRQGLQLLVVGLGGWPRSQVMTVNSFVGI